MTTAGAVIIGNELLSGKVQDANTPLLIKVLREVGVSLERVVIIADEPEVIAREVRLCAEQYDYVFTSGGVGPTHDDLTMQAIAEAFDVPLERHPQLDQLVRSYFGGRTNEAALRLAEIPTGAHLCTGGQRHWPTVCFRNIYILPGIPQIFADKLEALRPELKGSPVVLQSIYLSIDESTVAATLNTVVGQYPDVSFGSYPRLDDPDHRVRITVESREQDQVEAALGALLDALPAEHVIRVER